MCGKLAADEVRGELLAAKKLAALRLLDAQADGERLFTPAEVLPHVIHALESVDEHCQPGGADWAGLAMAEAAGVAQQRTGAANHAWRALGLQVGEGRCGH